MITESALTRHPTDEHPQYPLCATASSNQCGGEYVISSYLFIDACGDAVEVLLAQFVVQLLSKCSPSHKSEYKTRRTHWFSPAPVT